MTRAKHSHTRSPGASAYTIRYIANIHMLLSYPTVLVCYIITLIVASEVPDNFVKASYNDIGLINRDSSTKVDSINLLRCLSKNNITGSALVFVSDEGQLSVVVGEKDTDNKNSIKKSAALCYRVLGFSLSFSTSYNESAIDDGVQVLPLRDAILIENIDVFSRVVRNRRIVSSGLYQNATSSNTVASSSLGQTSTMNQERAKYYGYYITRVTQSSDCTSNEEIFSPSDECTNFKAYFNGYENENPNTRFLIANIWPQRVE